MSNKARHRLGIFQLSVFVALIINVAFSWPGWAFWANAGTLTIFVITHIFMAKYWGKESIGSDVTIFDAVWTQWYGWEIKGNLNFMMIDIVKQERERIEWAEKNTSGRWVKKYGNYIFFKKKDAVAFKLVFGGQHL